MAQRIINNFVNFGTDESDMHILGMGYSQNLYPEIIVDDSPKSTAKYYLRSILGMEKFIEFEQSYCRGIYVASSIDRLVAIFGTEVFVVEKDVDDGNFNKVKVGRRAAKSLVIVFLSNAVHNPFAVEHIRSGSHCCAVGKITSPESRRQTVPLLNGRFNGRLLRARLVHLLRHTGKSKSKKES